MGETATVHGRWGGCSGALPAGAGVDEGDRGLVCRGTEHGRLWGGVRDVRPAPTVTFR